MDAENQRGDDEGKQETGTAIVPASVQLALPTIANDLFGDGALTQLHNFQGTPTQIWREIALCENASEPGRELGKEQVFRIVNFYAHKVRLVNPRDGEVTEPTRVVLVNQDGKRISFVSDGIGKSLARILQIYGIGPWPEGIAVNLMEINTRSGYRTYALIPA